MYPRRLIDILGRVAATSRQELASRLCHLCSEELHVAGAGVMVMDGDALPATLCATDGVATRVEDLHFTLGEGPGIDAHRGGTAVVEPDMARPRRARWPAFAPAALDAGAAALFAFPLRVGGVRLGALTLHQACPGRLSDRNYADALAVADLLLRIVLARQADAPPGILAGGLLDLSDSRAEVHQASGMVSVQLGVSVAEALVRLRGHAYAEGRTLAAVAADVVARHLRMDG